MKKFKLTKQLAHPIHIQGSIMATRLRDVAIGEKCIITENLFNQKIVASGEVVGFKNELTLVSIMGEIKGLSRHSVIIPTGDFHGIEVNEGLLGAVVNASGEVVERISPLKTMIRKGEKRLVHIKPPHYAQRQTITDPFITQIKSIDSLLTCGKGQRIGIFSAAGSGKTTLLKMLIDFSIADVFVIGLVGERGREVNEFVKEVRESTKAEKTAIVFGTSDCSPLERANTALKATTIAEYFSGQGKDVVLFIDSVTRYSRALRDVGLAAGEMPVRRGYPVSVFERLPELLERAGNFTVGSITAFYTVLLENDQETDPFAEEIQSILDGHIYLSRELAEKYHFPAIDVLRSQSRLFAKVTSKEHGLVAAGIRQVLAKLKELELLVSLGEYKEGQNAENDHALQLKGRLETFLKQNLDDPVAWDKMQRELHALAG